MSRSLRSFENVVHSKQYLFSEVFEKRINGNRIYLLFFEFGYFKFALTFEPDYFWGHFQFFAMSKGFENFTSSGYRSIFGDFENLRSRSDILEFILLQLESSGIDLKNPEPVQLSLF